MKVLFLDVDGVLNIFRDYETIGNDIMFFKINRRCLERLHRIIKDTGCKLVLSSSWRVLRDGRKTLEKIGELKFIGETDDDGIHRGKQIKRWLDAHPEVENFCILDDDGDMLLSQQAHFVQTDPEFGLTETMEYRVKLILNEGPRVYPDE